MDYSFIYSVRFWKLFVVGVLTGAAVLWPDSIVLKAIAVVFDTWLGGSVLVRTYDRAHE